VFLLSARRDFQQTWLSWVYEFIVKEKEERHIDGFPVSGDGGESTVIVGGVFFVEQIRCSQSTGYMGKSFGGCRRTKTYLGAMVYFSYYLMKRWEMAGRS
jgi:hypothetical protein